MKGSAGDPGRWSVLVAEIVRRRSALGAVSGRRWRARLVGGVLLAVAAFLCSVVVAAPAHAATGWDRCPITTLCIFEASNGEGWMLWTHVNKNNLANPEDGHVFNDKTSSVWNRSSSGWGLFADSRQRGCLFVAVGNNRPFNVPSWANDRISSIGIGGPSGCPRIPPV
jgi:hypothetical protein